MHYARHGYFLRENQLLEDAARLPKVPTVIVHGARDITCPAEAAWALHRALPDSRLEILRTAGHLSSETPMIDALVRAADEVAAALEAR
jgi:proline iminopeptidase